MAADARDRDALDLLASRTFADCALVALDLDMQTRRLTMRVYGALRASDATTVVATLTFFGTSALGIEGVTTSFPQSARIAEIAMTYADDDDAGTVVVNGRAGWSMQFSFEGVACEEHAAVVASLVDDE